MIELAAFIFTFILLAILIPPTLAVWMGILAPRLSPARWYGKWANYWIDKALNGNRVSVLLTATPTN